MLAAQEIQSLSAFPANLLPEGQRKRRNLTVQETVERKRERERERERERDIYIYRERERGRDKI